MSKTYDEVCNTAYATAYATAVDAGLITYAAADAAYAAALAATEITFAIWKDSEGERGDDAHMEAIDAYEAADDAYRSAEDELARINREYPL